MNHHGKLQKSLNILHKLHIYNTCLKYSSAIMRHNGDIGVGFLLLQLEGNVSNQFTDAR